MGKLDFDTMVTLSVRDPGADERRVILFGTLRMAVAAAMDLTAQERATARITAPGLPEEGIPPPPLGTVAMPERGAMPRAMTLSGTLRRIGSAFR